MRLEPLMSLWVIVPLFTAMVALCVVLLVRRPPPEGRLAAAYADGPAAAGRRPEPVTPLEGGEQTQRMNANVFFVVDRTGSMNAEDYDGDQPRLEGVKADMLRIMDMTEGSRYG